MLDGVVRRLVRLTGLGLGSSVSGLQFRDSASEGVSVARFAERQVSYGRHAENNLGGSVWRFRDCGLGVPGLGV